MEEQLGSYYYTKIWFDFACQNPEKISPVHTALYLWIVELNNRLSWVEKFASPASQSMAYTGIKSYNTYKKIFDDLINMGFIKVIMESKNQYTACIIALSKFDKAYIKALSKHNIKHMQNQDESNAQSTYSVIKEEETIKSETFELINETPIVILFPKIDFSIFWDLYNKKLGGIPKNKKKWDSINSETQKKIIDTLPAFIKSTPDKTFRPYPLTYLNNERWNDEIITPPNNHKNEPSTDINKNQSRTAGGFH